MHKVVRRLRKESGMTQQQLADYLHVDRSTYAYYESGRTKLSIDVMVKLAHFYRVSYTEFLWPEPGDVENRDVPR